MPPTVHGAALAEKQLEGGGWAGMGITPPARDGTGVGQGQSLGIFEGQAGMVVHHQQSRALPLQPLWCPTSATASDEEEGCLPAGSSPCAQEMENSHGPPHCPGPPHHQDSWKLWT